MKQTETKPLHFFVLQNATMELRLDIKAGAWCSLNCKAGQNTLVFVLSVKRYIFCFCYGVGQRLEMLSRRPLIKEKGYSAKSIATDNLKTQRIMGKHLVILREIFRETTQDYITFLIFLSWMVREGHCTMMLPEQNYNIWKRSPKLTTSEKYFWFKRKWFPDGWNLSSRCVNWPLKLQKSSVC
jgi:hypothetical protein